MSVNQATINLIKEFEGFSAEAYLDPVGIWTIGYGTTAKAGVGIEPRRGMKITEAEAEWYLQKAVDKFAAQIEPLFIRPINANEFGAFVSLAYNIGPGAFANSTALRLFNAGDKAGAAEAMTWFNKARGKVLRGLELRRAEEKALFETPIPVDHVAERQTQTAPSGLFAALIAAITAILKAIFGGRNA